MSAKGHDQAPARWREVDDSLRDRFRDVAGPMDEAEHDVLADMAFDESLCSKLHCINPLERVNKEIKRCDSVVGIFANREAVIRFFGAPMMERNGDWAVSRRYRPTENQAGVCNDGEDATMITGH